MYRTTDLWLAASLMALGHKLIGTDKANEKRVNFNFEMTENIETVVADYKEQRLLVEPQNLCIQMKLLKGRLYN